MKRNAVVGSSADSRFACLDEVLLGYRQTPFNLRKTLTARRHMLVAQWRYFIRRDQVVTALLAVLVTLTKIGVDVVAALPGCSRLYFARMGEAVPPLVQRALEQARNRA